MPHNPSVPTLENAVPVPAVLVASHSYRDTNHTAANKSHIILGLDSSSIAAQQVCLATL
jgi:hypothetical protein